METKPQPKQEVKLGRNHRFVRLWKKNFGKPLWNTALCVLKRRIEDLGEDDVEEALLIAIEAYGQQPMMAFKYFCGVCRQKVNNMGEGGELVCVAPVGMVPFLARKIGDSIYPVEPPSRYQLQFLPNVRIFSTPDSFSVYHQPKTDPTPVMPQDG